MDTYGRMYTKTSDNKITAISVTEFTKGKGKYKPLSVQELLYERQYNKSLTGQNGIFTIADNAIGLAKITDNIKTLISALGTDTDENSRFYSKTQINDYLKELGAKNPTQDELKSLGILKEILSTPGEYAQVTTSTATEKNHINKAVGYI